MLVYQRVSEDGAISHVFLGKFHHDLTVIFFKRENIPFYGRKSQVSDIL